MITKNFSNNQVNVTGDKMWSKQTSTHSRYDIGFRPVKYYLKQYCYTDNPSQIFLAVTVLGKRYRLYTRLRVEPSFWDKDEQKCVDSELLSSRVRKRTQNINSLLSKIEEEIERSDKILAERGEYLSQENLRTIILNVVKPLHYKEEISPLRTLRQLAETYAVHLNARGQKGSSSSSQTYLMAIGRLERFQQETGYNLKEFSCFNKYFYNRFKEYLISYRFSKGGKELNYTSNTVLNTIRVINNLMHKASDLNLSNGTYYKASCSIVHEEAVKIYLTEKELLKMSQIKPLNQSELHIRDMFIIASYTALRISDINNLNNATFSADTIRIPQRKTKNEVCIPILKEITNLVDRYRQVGFPTIKDSLANLCVKELARRAGINEMILVPEIRGGNKIFKREPKYSQISFHTARRSCITNLYKRGYSVNYLMSLSGHRSIASFQRYVKSDAGEMSQEFIKELRKRRDM